MDLTVFLYIISIWAIPVLFAITLHEVAHGWVARYFGDRTAELLGRLSLNPLRHIDPVGTLLIPGSLLALGLPLFGWAKPVPVETGVLRNPRRAMIMVALAGPAANFLMALFWCGVLAAVLQIRRGQTLDNWVVLMAQAGIKVNAVLALFNLLPIPPLDGGRVLVSVLPARLGAGLEKIAPAGMFIVVGLSVLGLLGWLFRPAYRAISELIHVLGIGLAT
ncbi:MAG: site-2 protease family protein [Pseudomonadota bacterium]|nr:site-2 protease family protein [Pseudomonadota bacterium]